MTGVNASIITIGDELLIGQTIDTNSAFIAQELNKIGVWVRRRVAIADDKQAILKTLAAESKEADIIIITGGLGPTADDITKPALCEYFNSKLVVDMATLENVTEIFRKLGRPLTDRNATQAEVPDNCVVLPNLRGTAPGMWFEAPLPPKEGVADTQPLHERRAKRNKDKQTSWVSALDNPSLVGGGAGLVYVSLPGVPHEMKGLITHSVIPKIKESFSLPAVVHKTLLTAGQGESQIADRLIEFETSLPSYIKLAYLPAYGMVRLRLTGRSDETKQLDKEVSRHFEKLKLILNEWVVVDEDISLQEAVSRLLKEKKKTLATAESCTGGYIAHLITSMAGSSAIYNGSVVAYANAVKKNILEVEQETLQQAGAVSEETVKQMAISACVKMKTDYALATSGIMGPDGGTAEKPVGTIWISVTNKFGKVKAQKFNFRFDRTRNIELTAHAALNMLRKFVLEDE